MNFEKFLRIPFLQNTHGRLHLYIRANHLNGDIDPDPLSKPSMVKKSSRLILLLFLLF